MRLEHESPREAHTDALTRILRTYSGAHGHARARVQPRNANVSYITARDAQRRAHTLTAMFAGHVITHVARRGATIKLTLDDAIITIRHETVKSDFLDGEIRTKCEYLSESVTNRANEAIKNGQAILSAWVEKSYAHSEPSYQYGDDYGKTTETISLWVMFEGDLRPTRLTINQTTYTWDSYSPDFTLKHGDTTIAASDAYLYPDEDSSWYRY